jgi:hypothetical protein
MVVDVPFHERINSVVGVSDKAVSFTHLWRHQAPSTPLG